MIFAFGTISSKVSKFSLVLVIYSNPKLPIWLQLSGRKWRISREMFLFQERAAR